jgi:response regulator RpfG family c-di-GMP phosphodiesterase
MKPAVTRPSPVIDPRQPGRPSSPLPAWWTAAPDNSQGATFQFLQGQACPAGATFTRAPRLLIVDDEAEVRDLCRFLLEGEGFQCDHAVDGVAGLEAARATDYDLVLLDIDMPRLNGVQVLLALRASPPSAHQKVIMFSGRASADEMAQMLMLGADDYLPKPFSSIQFIGRVTAALRLKERQDHTDRLNRKLVAINSELEGNLASCQTNLVSARNALVLALTELVANRDNETGSHLLRVQRYCRCLSEAAADDAHFAGQITQEFIDLVECYAPLHDIGKVGVPDHILLKPGKLEPGERLVMQTHTVMGAEILEKVAAQHGALVPSLSVGVDITRHHHERFDGKGYPTGLAGEHIPLAARIVSVADVYDALRSRRTYKPAMTHSAVVQWMTEEMPGQFDPGMLQVFLRCCGRFEMIFQELPG